MICNFHNNIVMMFTVMLKCCVVAVQMSVLGAVGGRGVDGRGDSQCHAGGRKPGNNTGLILV